MRAKQGWRSPGEDETRQRGSATRSAWVLKERRRAAAYRTASDDGTQQTKKVVGKKRDGDSDDDGQAVSYRSGGDYLATAEDLLSGWRG